MEVQLAVIADCANIAAGDKLNILGVFDTIRVRRFPYRHPFFSLALRIRLEYADGEDDHKLSAVLVDADGKTLVRADVAFPGRAIEPGSFLHLNPILNFAGSTFARAGEYAFRILWDGKERQLVRLRLLELPAPEGPTALGGSTSPGGA